MDQRKRACAAIILVLGSTPAKRRCWMKEWLKKRETHSHLVLLREISVSEPVDFYNYFRMDVASFNKLLKMVTPYLARQDTYMRKCISVSERLAVTLRYLATGRSFEDLKFSAIMSPASISAAVLETCEVLIHVLRDYIKFPSTPEEWEKIAHEFGTKYQFWNCLGAVDGKHIAITKPAHSGSLYYNYKGFYSIVLLAVVDANREFIMVDAGINGRISDGGVFFYSKFGELFERNELNLPEPTTLPKTTEKFPYVFVGDEAFALHPNIMKPYPQKTLTTERQEFNMRLSRSRSCVENGFGIIRSQFMVFDKSIDLEPEKATTITLACCYLHNFLAKETPNYLATETTSKDPVVMVNLEEAPDNTYAASAARDVRDRLCNYFNNEGKLKKK